VDDLKRDTTFAGGSSAVITPRHTWTVSAIRQFEFEGCPIAYRIEGSGPPLVMIQGVGAYGTSPNPQIDLLKGKYQCLTFDNRGVGASVPAGREVTVPQMARDTPALMDHVGWQTAHLIGHSLGGLISMEVALAAKSRVRSLTLLNTFARGADASRMSLKLLWIMTRLTLAPRSIRRKALMELLLPPHFKGDAKKTADLLSGVFGHDIGDFPKSSNLQMKAMKAHDVTGRLSELAGIPTLVVSAECDPIARPAYGRAIANGIPGARYVEIANGSHAFPVIEAERCAQITLEHLDAAERGMG
jgi:pimeloyl-ACP methyl ester carboxylesterase